MAARQSTIVLLGGPSLPALPARILVACSGGEAASLAARHHAAAIVVGGLPPGQPFEPASLRPPDVPGTVPVVVLIEDEPDERLQAAVAADGFIDLVPASTPPAVLASKLRILLELHERARSADERARAGPGGPFAFASLGAHDGLWDWDIAAGRVSYSDRWKSMLGEAEEEVGDSPDEWLGRIHPDDLVRVRADLEAIVQGTSRELESEHRMRRRDGSYLWVLTRARAMAGPDGRPCRLAGSQTDIAHHKEIEARLRHEALHDALTKLPNRAFLERTLELWLARARRQNGYRFAVLFLDLDRLKVVNDSMGHGAGDELLRAVATRLHSLMRRSDVVARFAGDEFVILIDDTRESRDAVRIAERVHHLFDEPVTIAGEQIHASVSIGIVLCGDGYGKPADILRDADIAMYRAKALGRGRHEIFESSMHARAVALMELAKDVRRAVEARDYVVHYQPVVSLRHGSLVGLEALVRLRRPDGSLIHPADFLGLAEETGLIIPIGLHVIGAACEQLHAWHAYNPEARDLFVSVNVSRRLLGDACFVAEVERILRETQIPARCLRLEVTEKALLDGSAALTLKRLAQLDVGLDLDDFGTGHSPLSSLQDFPIHAVKIDSSLTHRLGRTARDTTLVGALVALAHNLGMNIIAEGVESAAQLELLRRLGCEHGQGFHISHPLCHEAAEALISSHRPLRLHDGSSASMPRPCSVPTKPN